MASDKITEIVDQSAFAQVDKLKLDLKALTDQFVQLFGGVEQFKKALATASNAGTLTKSVNDVTKGTDALSKAYQQQIELANKLRVAEHSVFQEKELAKQQNAELNKQNALHVKMVNAEVGSITEMTARLELLRRAYDNMGKANRDAFGADKLKNIQALHTELDKLKAATGRWQTNVGNYQNQTFQLSQVFREIPAFTYSATTGILALSNNLPMLADGFKQVATATNDATGKVNGTMGALKIFAKSIFSWTNAFTIAIGLITIFSKEITNFISNIGKANKAMNDLNEARLKGAKDAVAEKETLASLYRASTDMKRSIDERAAATNELQKLYPQTFKDFTAEDIALGKAKKGYDELGKSIESVARVKAIESRITEIISDGLDKQLDLERQLKEARLYKYTNEGKKQEFKIQGKEDRIVEDTDKTRAQAVQDAQNRLLDFKMEQEKKLKILRDAIDKEKVIVQDSPVMGGGSSIGSSKEVNRVKELQNKYENDLKIQKTAFNNEEMGLIIHLNKMLDITQTYSEKLKGITNLSKDEADSAIDFKLKASDVAKDALDDIREQVLTPIGVPKSKADKIVGKAIEIPVDVKVNIKINDKDITSLDDVIATLKKIQSVADDIGGAVSDINQLYFEREMSNLDVKDKRLKEYYDNELRFIEQSGFSEARKQKDKQRLEAETAAKQRKIEIDRITAMRKAARIQKAIDLAQAIQTTAISVITAFKEGDAWTKAARALIAAGVGAASIARIAATPLPQYAEGTDYHKGGSFIAGEKGVEQVILPSGKSFLTPSSATLFPDMPQGTKVINNKDLMQQVYNSAIVKLSTQGQVTPQKMMEAQMMAFEEMTDEVKGLRHDLRAKELTATFQDYAGFRNYKNSNIR